MIGILLAGGAATRLPNKPLLPQRDLQPVCFSGIDYLLRHKVSSIAVITPPNSVVVDVIDEYYGTEVDFNFIYQSEPTGVGDAINLVKSEAQLGMIVMGDNIYPKTETIVRPDCGPYIVIRRVPRWRIPHLVRIGADDRLTRIGPGHLALTTPWVVSIGEGMFSPEAWPDLDGVRRLQLSASRWWDIGTPEVYASYWRSEEEEV